MALRHRGFAPPPAARLVDEGRGALSAEHGARPDSRPSAITRPCLPSVWRRLPVPRPRASRTSSVARTPARLAVSRGDVGAAEPLGLATRLPRARAGYRPLKTAYIPILHLLLGSASSLPLFAFPRSFSWLALAAGPFPVPLDPSDDRALPGVACRVFLLAHIAGLKPRARVVSAHELVERGSISRNGPSPQPCWSTDGLRDGGGPGCSVSQG